jgi:hypothetical protein
VHVENHESPVRITPLLTPEFDFTQQLKIHTRQNLEKSQPKAEQKN